MTKSEYKKESMMIFASSCVEAAAKKLNISSTEMYLRMKRVGLVENFSFKCYEKYTITVNNTEGTITVSEN